MRRQVSVLSRTLPVCQHHRLLLLSVSDRLHHEETHQGPSKPHVSRWVEITYTLHQVALIDMKRPKILMLVVFQFDVTKPWIGCLKCAYDMCQITDVNHNSLPCHQIHTCIQTHACTHARTHKGTHAQNTCRLFHIPRCHVCIAS